MFKRFAQAAVVWSIAWVALLIFAYLASEGAPVCEGPLITSVAESYPPQCDPPRAALFEVGLLWYAIGFFPAVIVAGVAQARADRRSQTAEVVTQDH